MFYTWFMNWIGAGLIHFTAGEYTTVTQKEVGGPAGWGPGGPARCYKMDPLSGD